MQETRVRFLGQEVPPEKEMATDSRILAWRILWAVEPGRLQYMVGKESDRTERLTHVSIHTTDSHVSRIVCINLKGSEAISLCHGTYPSSSLFFISDPLKNLATTSHCSSQKSDKLTSTLISHLHLGLKYLSL